MSHVEIAPEVVDDFERILEHLVGHQVADPALRIRAIIEAIDVLKMNPHIGRPTGRENRELIIGRGSRGYVALYRYVDELDTSFVLAIRSQKEAGYAARS